ncbi:hypothetical protein JKF63_01485 [Porcisia hertigi]|uniref:Uncharacterized protein n=1 Tax=Porcisia hertigi TaxID=2761500 RepID=A0A836L3D1_9TRYP|nr:hypothetical protein JKF63_01485 [Porcisia hertigi]
MQQQQQQQQQPRGMKSAEEHVDSRGAACVESQPLQNFATDEGAGQPLLEVERLAEHGIGAADITKLKQAGIFTVPGVQMQCRKDLIQVKGLSEAKVDKIIDAARRVSDVGFITGSSCLQQRSTILRISTGSVALDQLLGGGGIESRSITEAFGEFRTGKTQIGHTLCVTCQLPLEMSGGNGKAVYVDTEGTFRPERIRPIAERFGLDPNAVLDNILVARAYTHEHQAYLLSMVAAKMAEDQFSLLVVDSITALFRVDFSGRGELAERQQKLAKMLSQLMKIAEEFNVAVYITNQVVADPGGASMFVADPKKPVGGHILAHASTTRLSLRKGRGDQRVCKIFDSPALPELECVYSISDQGITDAVD